MSSQKLGRYDDKPNKDTVYAQPRGYEFTYYLSDCVQDSHEYHEILQLLDTAGEQDTIRLVINNEGGSASTCVQIIDHIRSSKATVLGHISGDACSAAGLIWLACHQQAVAEHSMLMIHNAVGGIGGKYSDITSYITAANKRIRGLYEDIFEHFLSAEELDNVFKGEELWICFDEIVSRLEKRQELYEAEDAASQEKQFAEMFDQDEPVLPDTILNKLTKPDLVNYIKGNIDVKILEDGKFEIVLIDN
jgi:ATP-dependent Clp protease protease subunit